MSSCVVGGGGGRCLTWSTWEPGLMTGVAPAVKVIASYAAAAAAAAAVVTVALVTDATSQSKSQVVVMDVASEWRRDESPGRPRAAADAAVDAVVVVVVAVDA